jgi:hypothetical protein
MNGKMGFNPTGKGGLIWYTDGSKSYKGTRTGVYGYVTWRKFTFNTPQYLRQE